MKILCEVNKIELCNIEWMQGHGLKNVKLSDIFKLIMDGYTICNKICNGCGALTFWHDEKGQKCISCLWTKVSCNG